MPESQRKPGPGNGPFRLITDPGTPTIPALIGIGRKSDYIITQIQWIISNPGGMMKQLSAISNSELDEIVSRIVEVAQPEQVLLFGSTARGTTGPHSDLDLLIIKTGRYNARNVAGRIYRRMRGIARSIDLVIVTPQQVKDNRDSPFSVLYPALREGRVLYERKKAVA
jgi:predicted nucleotidyltransferase